jgi:hypothetical protein
MAGSPESEDEEKELRPTALETANIVLQIRQHAEQEIQRANEVLEQRTRALGQALVTMRATKVAETIEFLDFISVPMTKGAEYSRRFYPFLGERRRRLFGIL